MACSGCSEKQTELKFELTVAVDRLLEHESITATYVRPPYVQEAFRARVEELRTRVRKALETLERFERAAKMETVTVPHSAVRPAKPGISEFQREDGTIVMKGRK